MHFRRLLSATLALAAAALPAREPFRPAFHFTPERNWMNDPNGMVFHDGQWHLFYQYNPFGDKWGHMSWGHAVSRDLVNWDELPLALAEENGVMVFSGSAVVDTNNTSGFGTKDRPPLVAIYTAHTAENQSQALAYSTDGGLTWTKYAGNPVLDIGQKDFRDPKVIWHEPTRRWIMAVVLPTEHKVQFYASENLKRWTHLSDFGPVSATGGIWECPDLFPLPVEGKGGAPKWVLLVNLNPGGPAGGSGCQYFVGDFDGKTFRLDSTHLAGAAPARVLADFERSAYPAGWTAEGAAKLHAPTFLTEGDSRVGGQVGIGYLDTFWGDDQAQGLLRSPEFTLDHPVLGFRIAGGRHPGRLGIRLLADGKTVREATGTHGDKLQPVVWNVAELRGKKVRVEIFDHESGSDWGHLMLDHLALYPDLRAAREALWLDVGPDFYAAVTWSDVPRADGRRVAIGWMSNWDYAERVPTSPWRGAMTVPRSLHLRDSGQGLLLLQRPVAELASLRVADAARVHSGGSFAETAAWLDTQGELPALLDIELEAAFGGSARDATPFALTLHTGENEFTTVRIDPAAGGIQVDRSRSGVVDFHPDFATPRWQPLRLPGGKLQLRLLLDHGSLEVFANDGETALTQLILPRAGPRRLSLSAGPGKPPFINRLAIHPLRPASIGRR